MFVSSELNLSEQIIPHHLSNSKIESIGNFTSFCGGYFLWVDQSHLINQAQIYRKFECECLKVGLAWMQIWMRMPHGWLGMDSLYHLCPPILTCTLYQTIVWRPQVRFPEPAVRQYPPKFKQFPNLYFFFYKKASLINRVQFENSATLIQTPILTKKNVVSPIYAFLSVTKQQIFAF